jgi:hypothetical protein
MFKIGLAFLVCFVAVFFGITFFRNLTDKERWSLTKLVCYSIMCAVLVILILTTVVILF